MAKGSKRNKRASLEATESPPGTRAQSQKKSRTNTPVEEETERELVDAIVTSAIPNLEETIGNTEVETLESAAESSDEDKDDVEASVEETVAILKKKLQTTCDIQLITRQNIRKTDRNFRRLREDVIVMGQSIDTLITKLNQQKHEIRELKQVTSNDSCETDSAEAAEREAIKEASMREFYELAKDIESEYANFQDAEPQDKSIPLARAETIYSIMTQSHDEIRKTAALNDRRDIRIIKANANETLTKMKISQSNSGKQSGTAKPKLGLPEFDGDALRYFGWVKQWKTYNQDPSLSETEKARLLIQCLKGRANEAILPFSDESYSNLKKRLEERYGSKPKAIALRRGELRKISGTPIPAQYSAESR